jgi:hypothetical protein
MILGLVCCVDWLLFNFGCLHRWCMSFERSLRPTTATGVCCLHHMGIASSIEFTIECTPIGYSKGVNAFGSGILRVLVEWIGVRATVASLTSLTLSFRARLVSSEHTCIS